MGSTVTPYNCISPINLATNQNHFLRTQTEFYSMNTPTHWTTTAVSTSGRSSGLRRMGRRHKLCRLIALVDMTVP